MKPLSHPSTRNLNTLILSTLVLGLTAISHVSAAPFVWSGTGTDGNWSTGANWQGGVAPTGAGNDLTFTSGTAITLTSNNDGQLTSAHSITFSNATTLAFTLESTTGTTLQLTSGGTTIANDALGNATETINMNLQLGGTTTTAFQTSAGDTTLLGNSSGGGPATLDLNSTSLFILGNVPSTTAVGTTEIDSKITGAGNVGVATSLIVGGLIGGQPYAGNLLLTNDGNNYTAPAGGVSATDMVVGTLTVAGNTVLGADPLSFNVTPAGFTISTLPAPTLASVDGTPFGNAEGNNIVLQNAVKIGSSINVAPNANGTLELHGPITLLPDGTAGQVLFTGDTLGTVVITNTTAGSFSTNNGAIIFSGGIGQGANPTNLTFSGTGAITGLPGNFSGAPAHFIMGTDTFNYDGVNTYTGVTNVVNGALLDLDLQGMAFGDAIPGDLNIDATSTVRTFLDNEIAATSNVTVNGELDLNFKDHFPPVGAGAQEINSLQGTNPNAIISITNVPPVSDPQLYSDLEISNLVGTGSSFAGIITGGVTGGQVITLDSGLLVLYGGAGGSQPVLGNNYYGLTTINDGATLQAGTGSGGVGRMGYAFSANSDYVLDPSTLDLNGNNETVGSLAGIGNALNSAVGTTAILTVGGTNASTTFSGVIEDNAGVGGQLALVVNMNSGAATPGTLTLNGLNTYTGVIVPGDTGGDTMIKNGTLEVAASGALPTGTNLWLSSDGGIANGGTADDGLGHATLKIDDGLTQTIHSLNFVAPGFNNILSTIGTSDVTIGTGATLTVTGSINIVDNTSGPGNGYQSNITGGTLDLSGNTTAINIAAQNLFPGSNDLLISSVITNGGINYTGTPSTLNGDVAALMLDGVNTYALGTTINEGALIVGPGSQTGAFSEALGTGFVNNSGATGPSFLASYAFNQIADNDTTPATAQNILIGTTGTPAAYTQGINGSLDLGVVSSVGAPSAANNFGAGDAGINYDTVTVTGSATALAGNLSLWFAPGTTPGTGQHYVVLTSESGPVGTVSTFSTPNSAAGDFSVAGTTFSGGTSTNLPASFMTITTYNDTFGGTQPTDSVIVTLIKSFGSFNGLTPNQVNVANSVDANLNILNNSGALINPTGVNADFFNNIVTGLTTSTYEGTLGKSLDELSPQRYEILYNVAFDNYALDVQSLDNEFARERHGQGGFDTSGFTFNNSELGPELSQIKGRLLAWNPAPDRPGLLSDSATDFLGGIDMTTPKDMKETVVSEPLNKWNGFVDGGVDLGDLEHNIDSSHSSYTTGRVRGGIDYLVASNFRVGAMFGYSHTDADLDNEGSQAKVDSYTPGIYATYADKNGFYANALFTGTVNDYSTSRNIIIPGVNRSADGSTSGVQWGGNLDGGYEFHRGAWTFGPSAGLTYTNLGIDSFNESGAGSANLNVDNQSADSLRSRLGGVVSYNARFGSVIVTPHLSAYWQHEFLDKAPVIGSQFAGLPAGNFNVTTPSGDSDNALLGFGIDAQINKNVTVFVDYSAEAGGSSFFGQSAMGGVKIGF